MQAADGRNVRRRDSPRRQDKVWCARLVQRIRTRNGGTGKAIFRSGDVMILLRESPDSPASQQNRIAMTNKLPKLPTAPREVIEHIRRYEFGIGASLDAEGRVIVANMQRRYQSLLATVAEDLNSKESHFILELVQNAEDNSYADGVAPSLSFSAEKTRLLVVNNELGFRPENVAALCSAGESSKKNKTGYIGEKGIGFKSV